MVLIDGINFTQDTNLNVKGDFYIGGVPAPYQGSFATQDNLTGAHTTSGNEFIKLDRDLKITLNPTPADEEWVWIKSATGKGFNVSSIKKMDGQRNIRYATPYILRGFSYSSNLGVWSIT